MVTIGHTHLPNAIVKAIKWIEHVSKTDRNQIEHFLTNIPLYVDVRLRWLSMPMDRDLRSSERDILIGALRIRKPGAQMFLLFIRSFITQRRLIANLNEMRLTLALNSSGSGSTNVSS